MIKVLAQHTEVCKKPSSFLNPEGDHNFVTFFSDVERKEEITILSFVLIDVDIYYNKIPISFNMEENIELIAFEQLQELG